MKGASSDFNLGTDGRAASLHTLKGASRDSNPGLDGCVASGNAQRAKVASSNAVPAGSGAAAPSLVVGVLRVPGDVYSSLRLTGVFPVLARILSLVSRHVNASSHVTPILPCCPCLHLLFPVCLCPMCRLVLSWSCTFGVYFMCSLWGFTCCWVWGTV